MYKQESSTNQRQGAFVVYAVDTITSGNDKFLQFPEKISESFEGKRREYPPLMFAAIKINKGHPGYV